jgi:diacylglycerol O-acyltransferase
VRALNTVRKILSQRKQAPGERSLNLGLAPKTPFNVSITNQRSYSTMSLPLDELKALGKRAGGTVNTVVMAMCSGALRRYLAERNELPDKPLIAMVPVSLRAADDDSMNNQVSAIRVDLATELADPAERFKAIHASSEAAKGVVSALKPVLGADTPILGSPWLMTGLASLYGRSNLASRMSPLANVTISNVPGLPVTLYMAGAKMVNYFPVSIPYHGAALNITVQSYAGKMEFGVTVCRRVMTQPEAHELIEHLKAALREIEALTPAEAAEVEKPAKPTKSARAKRKAPAVKHAPTKKAAAPVRAAARRSPAPRAKRAATAAAAAR